MIIQLSFSFIVEPFIGGLYVQKIKKKKTSQKIVITAPVVSDCKNSAAINNRYLDFVQTCSLILLVNDKHVDNRL